MECCEPAPRQRPDPRAGASSLLRISYSSRCQCALAVRPASHAARDACTRTRCQWQFSRVPPPRACTRTRRQCQCSRVPPLRACPCIPVQVAVLARARRQVHTPRSPTRPQRRPPRWRPWCTQRSIRVRMFFSCAALPTSGPPAREPPVGTPQPLPPTATVAAASCWPLLAVVATRPSPLATGHNVVCFRVFCVL